MSETIRHLFARKIDQAKEDVRNARIQKDLDIAKADARIDACLARLGVLENLEDLNWEFYAKNQLDIK